MRLFDQMLKIDPNNISAHLSRANVNITLGKYKAADEDIGPILKASPDYFMPNYLRRLELAKQQKYAEADRIFDRISPGFTAFSPGYYAQEPPSLSSDNMPKRKRASANMSPMCRTISRRLG